MERILFIGRLVDLSSGAILEFGDEASLVDETTGYVLLDDGTVLENVSPSKYVIMDEEDPGLDTVINFKMGSLEDDNHELLAPLPYHEMDEDDIND